MIKFSVIIPTYNRLDNLKIALNSVLKQTYQEFEIIIVDDGSKDKTQEYIESLKNNKIKYIWQENSGLPSVARNNGIKLATNEWISFLDSDDFWEKDKLEFVKNEILNNQKENLVAIGHWENLLVNGIKKNILKHGIESDNIYEELLFKGNVYSTSAMTVRKNILDKLDGYNISAKYYIVEDYELWLRVSKMGDIKSINKVLGSYCLGESDNISSNVDKLNDNLINVVIDNIEKLDIKSSDKNNLKKIHISRINYYRGRSYQLNGDFEKAIPILINSIKEYPFSIKKYISLIFAFLGVQK
jgi:glycosyltransferase involved in cell wall biosynthesis